MIIVKNKTLFGTCLALITLVALPSVLAFQPMVAKSPVWFNTYKGSKIYGDLDDLQRTDGDVVHWQGIVYDFGEVGGKPWWWMPWWYWPHYCGWQIGASVAFDRVFNIESDNYLNVKYRLYGPGTLRVVVWYFQGGSDTYYKYDTGGAYTDEFIYFDDYKSVSHVDFDYLHTYIGDPTNPPANTRPYFWVDYVAVYYGFN